jgi:alanine-synthesizing transaminase
VIADTFLSVATPPQVALPLWLQQQSVIQQQILARVQTNLSALDSLMRGSALSRLKIEGGWAVVLRVPAIESDTDLAVRLLREHSVAFHPGSLYGFPQRGWLVLSLLPEAHPFQDGIERLLSGFAL